MKRIILAITTLISLTLLGTVSCKKSPEQELVANPDKTLVDGHSERFARDIAYEDHKVGEVLGCATDGNYTVVKVFDHWKSDGLYATAFLNDKDNHILLAFRGTSSLASILADTDKEGVGYKAYKKYADEVLAWAGEITKTHKLHMVGHSLGGALAQWFTVGMTSKKIHVEQLETYNAPGISTSYIQENYKEKYCSKVINRIQSGDIVSMAGWGYVPGENLIYYFFNLNPLAKHSTPMLIDEVGGRKKPSDLTHISIDSENLSSIAFHFSKNGWNGYYDYVYHTQIYLATKITTMDIFKCLHHRGTTEGLRATAGFAIEGVIQLLKFFGIVNMSHSVSLKKSFIGNNVIILDVTTDEANDYEIFCITEDPQNPGIPLTVKSTSVQALPSSPLSITFDNLKPGTDYSFGIARYKYDNGIRVDLLDYNILLLTTLK